MSDDEIPPSPEELQKMLESAKAYAEKKRQEQKEKFENREVTIDIKSEATELQKKLDEMNRKKMERAKSIGGVPKGPPRAT
ncbi:MAG: hypothetical protein EAX96_00245 [Candidatus Lokiarchaeota archaeon]|nr:hypothetical protein [Candidatus Lokiarchaeota archaeon]